MMNSFKQWYIALTVRERWMVSVAFTLSLALIAIYGFYMPLTRGIAEQRIAYREALERRISIETTVAQLTDKPKQHSRSAPATPLDQWINGRAVEAGFALDGVTLEGEGRASFSIASARPASLMKWLAENEAAGVVVDSAGITPAGPDTVAVKLVVARTVT